MHPTPFGVNRDDDRLVNAIVDIHGDDPEFGKRLIADELDRAGPEADLAR